MVSGSEKMSYELAEEIPLEKYVPIIGEIKAAEIRALAKYLIGKKVCHVNSTSFGGGVAEILHRLVPLLSGLGLKVDWKVIKGSDEFFKVTKAFHNGLQGMNIPLTEGMKKTYMKFNKVNAKKLDLDHDFVVIHDNQPAAVIGLVPAKTGKWIWRCHIDLSSPNQTFFDFLTPLLLKYDALIFTMERFVHEPLKPKKIFIIPPSIDPLSPKNQHIPESLTLSILDKYDIDADKPIIAQVGRFDPWKDPLGIIDVYKLVKKKVPNVQLLLIASMAKDDPEGRFYYEKTAHHAGEDYDIHLLTDLNGVGDIEVNALQRASNVVLQKSIREGFGLSVTEALWKGVPVIGSNVGGIPLQVIDGETGFLVDSIEEGAEKTLYLLEHPDVAQELGKKGREHVLKNFLITRHVEDYLKLLNSL
jgi:trehalose synthase